MSVFSGLSEGTYTLELTDQSGYRVSKKITVDGKAEVRADFIPTYTIAPADELIRFVNNSMGAASYEWDFGDGATVSGVSEPYHSYADAGKYIATLKAFNDDCDDVFSREITIYKIATGIQASPDDEIRVSTIGEFVLIHFDNPAEQAELTIHNIIGQRILQTLSAAKEDIRIALPAGNQYYFLTVKTPNAVCTTKLFTLSH